MTIEELQKMKEKIGLKLFNKAISKGDKKKPVKTRKEVREAFKRENKNRPREMSSKKTVGRFRDVVGVSSELNQKVKVKRDPRFDTLCGEFNDELFKKSYKFVDDIRAKERLQLKEELRTETDPERIEQIKYLIQRYDNQMREKKLLETRKAAKEEEREKNKELVQSGMKPVYRNKMENKNKELVDKFEELKKSGGLDKYMKSKTKKNFVKDRKKFGSMK